MSQLGLGVMLSYLSGCGQNTAEAVKASLNKVITALAQNGETLNFEFSDGTKLSVWDGGQSCCESRYMRTDDDLAYYVGSTLLDIEVDDAAEQGDCNYGCHEIQFLKVKTSKGVFVMSNHNEHNGYYGGFSIRAAVG